jgi:hypothetical protein
MNNDDRDPPAEREKQVNEKPAQAVPQPQTGQSPYDKNGKYHHERTYEREYGD